VITDGNVVLDEPAGRIPATSIQRVWLRGRAVRKGATIGGTILGASGALLGLLFAAYCVSESECGDGVWLTASAAGFGIGAAAGALTGGLAGAAIPKWHHLDFGVPHAPLTERGPTADRIGTFSLQGGWARGRDRNSAPGGLGGRLGLSADLPGGFAPGLEVGRFNLGRGEVTSPRGVTHRFNESVLHVGLSLTKTRDHGRLRPYGLAGLGYYSWRGFDSFVLNPDFDYLFPETHRSFLGASLGGGARYRARRNLSLEMEGRWHTSLHKVAHPTFEGPAQHWNMVSVTAGARFLW
jgi:hypothetical protein